MASTSALPTESKAESDVVLKALDFDPHGDVVFVLREGKMRFRVNSHILSFVSSVFKVLLGTESRFKEATELAARGANSPPLDVPLGDDDPEAMEITLWAIHHRGDMVPSKVDVSLLHKIAVVCDKYCIPKHTLKVWLEKWIPSTLNMDELDDKWLFISYVFDDRVIFKAVSKSIILNCILNPHGECVRGIIKPASNIFPWVHTTIYKEIDLFLPQRILDKITAARKLGITSMLSVLDNLARSYQDSSEFQCRYALADSTAKGACDAINLGFIIRKLKAKDLYPKTGRNLDQTSLKTLKTHLESFDVSYSYLEVIKGCCDYPKQHKDLIISSLCRHCRGPYKKADTIHHKNSCDPFIAFRRRIYAIYDYVDGLDRDNFAKKDLANKEDLANKVS